MADVETLLVTGGNKVVPLLALIARAQALGEHRHRRFGFFAFTPGYECPTRHDPQPTIELLGGQRGSQLHHLSEHVRSVLRSQAQDDQSPVFIRWMSSDVREPEIQCEQGTTLGATSGSDALIVRSYQPPLEHRARVMPVRPQQLADLLGQVLVDLDPRYAAPGCGGIL